MQIIAAVALIAAVGWRSGAGGAVAAVGADRRRSRWPRRPTGTSPRRGSSDNPAPHALWIWIGLTGFAAAVLVAGWRGRGGGGAASRWLALPLCLLVAALALNLWVGYFPTVQTAWNQLTAGPLPDQTDQVTVDRDAAAAQDPDQGHRGAGRHQRRGVGFQAPRRAGLPAAGLVRHQPAAAGCRR